MSKKIDYRFKILYALATLMIVCGHTLGGSISFFDYWFPLGGMHLCLFVFASGYFYSDDDIDDIKSYILKKIKKLIIPLYLYNFVYAIIITILSTQGFYIFGVVNFETLFINPLTNSYLYGLNLGSWFIMPLFLCEIFNILIRRLLKNIKIHELIYFIIYLLIGISLVSLAIYGHMDKTTLALGKFGYFLPYYGLGIIYHKILEKKEEKISNLLYIGIIFFLKLVIAFFLNKMPYYTPSNMNDFIDGPIIPFIAGFLGILFWFKICSILEPSLKNSKAINTIADSSFSIMMNQFLAFYMLKGIFAFIARNTNYFADFNFDAYHSDIFYYYLPHNLPQMLILYVFMGIFIPILIQKGINLIKRWNLSK